MEAPDWLKALPKTDLHCHMGGSIRIPTMLTFASKYGVDIPADTEDGLADIVMFHRRKQTLLEKDPNLAFDRDLLLQNYIACFEHTEKVLAAPEAIDQATYEIAEDAHNEGVIRLELRFNPMNYINNGEGMKLWEVVEAGLSGLKRASKEYGISTGLIICGTKDDLAATAASAEIAVQYRDQGVVGFDLAGPENRVTSPYQFRQVIKDVSHCFMPVTIHAGEADTVRSVAEAIYELGARRIGHGVSTRESEALIKYMQTMRLPIEACPTSNRDTGAVLHKHTHPIRDYFRRGLRICINTDNRTVSDTNSTKELQFVHEELGFSKLDMYELVKDGIKSSFVELAEKEQLLNKLDTHLRTADAAGFFHWRDGYSRLNGHSM